jgi:hypothetical protein
MERVYNRRERESELRGAVFHESAIVSVEIPDNG